MHILVEDHGGHKELRYDGRTVKLVIYVNTDEDEFALATRVCAMIKDTGCCPMVAGAGVIPQRQESDAMWDYCMTRPG